MIEENGPNIPDPKPIPLDPRFTAVAVLDLTTRCQQPHAPCAKLLSPVGSFLERVRVARVPVVYTVSLRDRGTELGVVAPALKRREAETVVYPNSFDKFFGEDLYHVLQSLGVKNLVITGAATNIAVMYTATTAARVYEYNVVIPMDGVVARSRYEHEYALHQLHALPAGSVMPIQFSTLSGITCQQ